MNIHDVLKLDVMKNARVLAGKSNLDNHIKSVSVLEIPESTPFIKEGELLISAFFGIKENIKKQIQTIKMLKKVNASGLVLANINYTLKHIDTCLINICKQLDFPLLLAPSELAYIDLISPILNHLLCSKNKQLQQTIQVYDLITDSAANESDPEQILILLSNLLERPILYIDSEFSLIYKDKYFSNNPDFINIIKNKINNNINLLLNNKDVYSRYQSNTILMTPVLSNIKYYGTLVITPSSQLSDLDLVAINQVKSVISTITLSDINKSKYKSSLKKDFINDLLHERNLEKSDMIKRGLELECNIQNLSLVLVVDIFNFSIFASQYSENKLMRIKSRLLHTIKGYLDINLDDYLITDSSDKIIIIIHKHIDKNKTLKKAKDLGWYLKNVIESTNNFKVTIGIGGYYENYKDMNKSYQEARKSIDIYNNLHENPGVVLYEDIKLYDLIFNSINMDSTFQHLHQLLHPIISYDNKNSTNLLETFQTLLSNKVNIKDTSEDLFIHRNTVMQRRSKIMELLDEDPFSNLNYPKYMIASILYKYIRNIRQD